MHSASHVTARSRLMGWRPQVCKSCMGQQQGHSSQHCNRLNSQIWATITEAHAAGIHAAGLNPGISDSLFMTFCEDVFWMEIVLGLPLKLGPINLFISSCFNCSGYRSQE